MKSLFALSLFSIIAFSACKKDKKSAAPVVIIQEKGLQNNAWAAYVVNPDPSKYDFLCAPPLEYIPKYNCTSAVYILNLPANLAVPGKKISFTHWDDHGQNPVLSSINHAHEIEVHGITEVH